MKNTILLLFCYFVTSCLHAEIAELQNFKDVVSYLKPGTLVILDIDDTLLIPTQMLGCDEWFQSIYKKSLNKGLSKSEALKASLQEWEAIRHITHMELPEAKTDEVVKLIQQQKYDVIGLTTQNYTLSEVTPDQLQANGIDLARSAFRKDDCYFMQGDLGILYRKGILYTSGTPKGKALFTLCEKTDYKPTRIVFVNDKLSHLQDIEEVAKEKNVEYVGLRYAYPDARKKSFSEKIADIQFANSDLVKGLVSDKEAQKILGQERAIN